MAVRANFATSSWTNTFGFLERVESRGRHGVPDEGLTLYGKRVTFLTEALGLATMTPEGYDAIIHVTLTDDHPWAQAFVVIEARPLPVLT